MKTCKKSIFALLIALLPLLATCTSLTPDVTLYLDLMRQYAQQRLVQMPGIALRDIAADYQDYVLGPNPLFLLLFGGARELEIPLFPYESDHIANTCLSQFESPPDSSIFWDFACVVRPNANLRAPILHGDAGGVGGMTPSFSMDFYNVTGDQVDIDTFLGDQLPKINEALALVASYQRQGDERGKLTPHLDPYKSVYRIEMEEPEDADEAEKEAYATAVYEAFTRFFDAYLTSLENLTAEDDEGLMLGNRDGADDLIQTLYDNDFVAQVGPTIIFRDQDAFDRYFLDAFWREGYYGEGL